MLEQDPRPSYQNSEERVYGLSFAGMEIKFQVKDQVLHVVGQSTPERKPAGKQGDIQEKWRRRKQKYVISKYDTVPVCQ